MKKLPLLALASIALAGPALGQTTPVSSNAVTEIITNYKGFWRSGNGTAGNGGLNPIQPDNSHDLLAFRFNTFLFSTGVDDAALTSNGVTGFLASEYQALPVLTIAGQISANTKVAQGQLKDGVENGPSVPSPPRALAPYLTDGVRGLDIGTGVANIPAGNVVFSVSSVDAQFVGDGNPDIIISQIADPGGSDVSDVYQFLDANDAVVGNPVSIVINNISSVGNWLGDFYEASQDPMTLGAGFTKSPRGIRLWAADFAVFGINTTNIGQIRKFRINFNGSSDPAFVAFNTKAAKVPVLPVTLTSFGGQGKPSYSDLTWNTAQEVNSAAFEVQYSTTGRDFAVVGRVDAAGSSTTAQHYTFRHATSQAGARYYRLRQLDLDGTSTYSAVVTLAPAAGATRVTAAPNPFGNSLRLLVSGTGAAPAKVQVRLSTLTGNLVHQREFERPGQSAALELTGLASLPAGLYLVQVVIDGQITVLKVVKE